MKYSRSLLQASKTRSLLSCRLSSSWKRNVTVWRPSVHLSVCRDCKLTVTYRRRGGGRSMRRVQSTFLPDKKKDRHTWYFLVCRQLLILFVVDMRRRWSWKFVEVDADVLWCGCQTDGGTGFLRAARSGNIDKVLEYLSNSVDIDVCNAVSLRKLLRARLYVYIRAVRTVLQPRVSLSLSVSYERRSMDAWRWTGSITETGWVAECNTFTDTNWIFHCHTTPAASLSSDWLVYERITMTTVHINNNWPLLLTTHRPSS